MEEVGDERHALQLTPDEVDRFTNAFRDCKFREMLCDYAQEISDPANRKKYEEEIKLLEQERGNRVEFVHPTPFSVIKTSAAGKQKCFINICCNEKIGKPDFKSAVSQDGRRGQCWSLPLSLSPGRQNTTPKGHKCVIYDVIFHPDTLYMASQNKSFMDMVHRTAIDEVQEAFKVILDKNNVREIKTKYKGAPQPCVIRTPIPGYEAKGPPEEADPLAFPYPDEPQTKLSESPLKTNSGFEIQPQQAEEPTKPSYTVKYRSVIDLQDFRCSRDSAQSPRPKEIVITVDLPLLKAVGDTSLEVKDKVLRLESKRPSYRLELPLSYPVDEDKGEAKFNKQHRQLTVTLPVQPPREEFSCFDPATPANEVEADEMESKKEKGLRMEKQASAGEQVLEEEHQKGAKELLETREQQYGTGEQEGNHKTPEREGQRSEEQLPQLLEENREVKYEQGQLQNEHDRDEDMCDCFNDLPLMNFSAEEDVTAVDERTETSSKAECQHMSTSDELIPEEEVGTLTSESTCTTTTNVNQTNVGDVSISEGGVKSAHMFLTDVTNTSSSGDVRVVSLKQEEDAGEVPEEQVLQTPERDKKPPAATLREMDADGNETVISDHSTSAGFIFQNKLLYELD